MREQGELQMVHVGSKNDQLLNEALSPTSGCASAWELEGLAGGSLSPAAASRVREHLGRCPSCRKELALLDLFQSGSPRAEETEAVSWISDRLAQRLVGSPDGAPPAKRRRWSRVRSSSAGAVA